jgi:hypothetical protein
MASRRAKNDRRKQEKRLKRLRRLKHKGERSAGDKGPILIHDPPGMEKMSEALELFVEPYMEGIPDTVDDFRKLLMLGMMAWNTALLPENEQKAMIDRFVDQTVAGLSEGDRRDFQSLFEGMIERKKTYFSQIKRGIVSFDLRDGDDDYYLSVVSTLGARPFS